MKPILTGMDDTFAHKHIEKVNYVSRSAKTFVLYSDSESYDSIEEPKLETQLIEEEVNDLKEADLNTLKSYQL